MGEDEFNKIYQLYVKEVFKFLLKLTRNYELAEEFTQETFVKAFINIDTFKGNSKLIVWLCQIGKNSYFDYLKYSNRLYSIENIKDCKSKGSLEDNYIEKNEAEIIHTLLMQLNEPYKTVFVDRVYLELSYKEIGTQHRKNEGWARVTYYRAKCMIQKRMGEMIL